MINRTMKLLLVLLIPTSLFLLSCDKEDNLDDDNSGGTGNNETFESFITFNISGDQTDEFSSDAQTGLQGSPANGYDFIISRGPDDALTDGSFWIYITSKFDEIPTLPIPTGSFNLVAASDLERGDGNYSVGFTNFNSGTDFGYEVDGTLNITESNDNYLEGDFNFTATSFTSGEEEVTVTGTFLAPTSY